MEILDYLLPTVLSIDNLFGGASAGMAPAIGAGGAATVFLGLSLTGRIFIARESEV